MERRPIETRNKEWVKTFAWRLGRAGVMPNHVSLASIVFAFAGSAVMIWVGTKDIGWSPFWLWAAALCVQLRLVCNLLDGVIAVEMRRGSPTGELYNEVPDRITDTAFIVALGWATQHPIGTELGWAAALTAMLTAYVRVLGKACGTPAYFWGPMAKPHRMALLTAVLVLAPFLNGANRTMLYLGCLSLITLLSLATAWRRLRGVAHALDEGVR